MNRDARLAATAPDRSPDRGEAIPLACHYLASIAEVISTGTSLFLPATLELLVEDMYNRWSSPLICSSITAVTVFCTVSAEAPR